MNTTNRNPEYVRPNEAIRASDEDRESIADALGQHYEAGRLTTAEFTDRIGAVYEARTLGELDTLTSDLPRPALRPERSALAGQARRPASSCCWW
ncbi:MAG: DUF1707 SHOCT-like domain-containing protein [Marmoricola sp.]